MNSTTLTSGVTLSGNSGLDVDDRGKAIPVPHQTDPMKLVWQLTGSAAHGSFNAMSGPDKGFSWIDTPPVGVFSDPSLAANGNQVRLTDNNISSNSTGGPWRYKLCATVNGQLYTTTASASLQATTNNPAIKNN